MTVLKDVNGTYYVRTWYKTWRGERKQKTKRGFEKLKDAKKWEREFLSLEHRCIVKMHTLIDLYKEHLDIQETLGKLRRTTVITKKTYIDTYISNYFHGVDTENVTIDVINKWIAYIAGNGKRNGALSSSTINVVRNILSQIFDFGIKFHGLKVNPVKQSEAPAKHSNNRRAKNWEVNDYNIFYSSLDSEMHKALFNVLYWAGLRIGEALALTPADINDNSITINKTWISISKEDNYSSKPKTQHSIREISVPLFLIEQLKNYVKSLEGVNPTDRLFPVSRGSLDYYLKYRIKKLGLPFASLHTMRHSYISNILAQTQDCAVAAAQAGDTTNTLFRHYVHPLKASIEKAVESLEKLHEN